MAKKPKNDTEEKVTQAEPKVDEKANPECEKLKAELEAKTKECEALDDRCKRLAAEFDNYKKRTVKEKESIYTDSVCDVVEKMLPVLDNLERAIDSFDDKESEHCKGVEMVLRQTADILKKIGVEEIDAVGEKFDPTMHNAVMHIDDDNYGENTIAQQFQKGYKYKDKVIRYSMVQVAN